MSRSFLIFYSYLKYNYSANRKNSILFSISGIRKSILIGSFFIFVNPLFAQHKQFSEANAEVDFSTKPVKRYLFGLDLTQGTRADTGQTNVLKYNSYSTVNGWFHFYPTRVIKLTLGGLYRHNQEIAEVNQPLANEYRISFYSLFNVTSRRFYLSHRAGIEFRWQISDKQTLYNTQLRYRFKAIMPVNKKELVRGVFFLSLSEEIIFTDANNPKRTQLINLFITNPGIGYCLTDNVQIEPTYSCLYHPLFGTDSSDLTNVWSIRITFNNLFIGYLKPKK